MNRHSSFTSVLRAGVVMAVVACGLGCTQEGTIDPSIEAIEIITVGKPVQFERTACGGVVSWFEGRIEHHDASGAAHPVTDATFWFRSADASFRRELLIELDESGEFSECIGSIGPAYKLLAREVSIPEDRKSALPIVIHANGCEDYLVSYTPDWEAKTITLECPERMTLSVRPMVGAH